MPHTPHPPQSRAPSRAPQGGAQSPPTPQSSRARRREGVRTGVGAVVGVGASACSGSPTTAPVGRGMRLEVTDAAFDVAHSANWMAGDGGAGGASPAPANALDPAAYKGRARPASRVSTASSLAKKSPLPPPFRPLARPMSAALALAGAGSMKMAGDDAASQFLPPSGVMASASAPAAAASPTIVRPFGAILVGPTSITSAASFLSSLSTTSTPLARGAGAAAGGFDVIVVVVVSVTVVPRGSPPTSGSSAAFRAAPCATAVASSAELRRSLLAAEFREALSIGASTAGAAAAAAVYCASAASVGGLHGL